LIYRQTGIGTGNCNYGNHQLRARSAFARIWIARTGLVQNMRKYNTMKVTCDDIIYFAILDNNSQRDSMARTKEEMRKNPLLPVVRR